RREQAEALDAQLGLALGDAALRLAGELLRGRHGVALDDVVEDALRQRVGGFDVVALEHDLQRIVRADQTREALRAAGAGQQAQLDLRQAEPRLRRRDAVVARQRQLEAAALRVAVDRRDVRLRALVDRRDHV